MLTLFFFANLNSHILCYFSVRVIFWISNQWEHRTETYIHIYVFIVLRHITMLDTFIWNENGKYKILDKIHFWLQNLKFCPNYNDILIFENYVSFINWSSKKWLLIHIDQINNCFTLSILLMWQFNNFHNFLILKMLTQKFDYFLFFIFQKLLTWKFDLYFIFFCEIPVVVENWIFESFSY